RAGFDADSHSGKAVLNILEGYPRDELFQVDVDTLFGFVMEILLLYERPRIRALLRPDKFDRFVSIIVFVPRDKFNSEVGQRVGAYLAAAYRGRLSASYPSFPEGPLARIHYIIGRSEGITPAIERQTLEAAIAGIASSWADKLREALSASTEGFRARDLAARYAGAFEQGYQEAFDTRQAVVDIETIERLTPDRPVALELYHRDGDEAGRLN